MATKECIEQIKVDEGFRHFPYMDTLNYPTVGYGYNLHANPQNLSAEQITAIHSHGISKEFAEQLLLAEIKDVENELHLRLDFWSKLNAARQSVLINMAYNLGTAGLMKFKNTLLLIRLGHYTEASRAMLKSRWARQVKGRANRLSAIMYKGSY